MTDPDAKRHDEAEQWLERERRAIIQRLQQHEREGRRGWWSPTSAR